MLAAHVLAPSASRMPSLLNFQFGELRGNARG